MATATAVLAAKIGAAVKEASRNRAAGWWYGPHMSAASRAIAERIPLVDLILELRDARIPLSSQFEQLKDRPPSSRRIVGLNKTDLANSSQVKEWMSFMEHQKQVCYGINSHNRESIKKFLNFLQAQIRLLKKVDYSSSTITILLVGVPNVGKSALVNSLHKIGRTSAAEKGKLKHATVSPQPCETTDISSFKIASNPNVYVLDTPGVLPPIISDADVCSKLALTGTTMDRLAGEKELARYFLSILNSGKEYMKWADLSSTEMRSLLADCEAEYASRSDLGTKRKGQYPSDHTQDFVVNDVRRTIYEEASSLNGKLAGNEDCMRLIESQLEALHEAFRVPPDLGEESCIRVCRKLLNLFRTGRLGHYTLDSLPNYINMDPLHS